MRFQTPSPEQRRADCQTHSEGSLKRSQDAGLTVYGHPAAKGMPGLFFTLEGITDSGEITGAVWTTEPVRINAADHWINGYYRLTDSAREWKGSKSITHDGPTAYMTGGYPSISRLDGGEVTSNARVKLERWMGSIIAAHVAAHGSAALDEARANERELTAQSMDRAAQHEYQRAAEILKTVGQIEQRAAATRAGGDYDRRDLLRGIHLVKW